MFQATESTPYHTSRYTGQRRYSLNKETQSLFTEQRELSRDLQSQVDPQERNSPPKDVAIFASN